jgi:hypothetical protein
VQQSDMTLSLLYLICVSLLFLQYFISSVTNTPPTISQCKQKRITMRFIHTGPSVVICNVTPSESCCVILPAGKGAWSLSVDEPYLHICGICSILLIHFFALLCSNSSFVPAESAVVGLADRIFTRVMSQERVAMGHSSFMIDLTQVDLDLTQSHALQSCLVVGHSSFVFNLTQVDLDLTQSHALQLCLVVGHSSFKIDTKQ